MGFSRSAQVGKERKIQDRSFVSKKAVPYGRIVASDVAESFGASANLSKLRAANSNTTQSRMSLPLTGVARAGTQSFSATPIVKKATETSDDFALYDKLSNRSLQDRGAMGAQDIDLSKRKIREVDTLANNEANRAYGMKLATEFPYEKYNTETSAARESMGDTLRTMSSFLNRNTAVKPQQYVSF